MKVTICIAAHGQNKWRVLAERRAVPSAERQCSSGLEMVEVLYEYDSHPDATRADVRNRLAERAAGDWLCFLDADDELEDGYMEAMAEAEAPGCLLTPAVSYSYGHRRKPAKFWPEVAIERGNWIVVGTLIEKSLFQQIGGWTHLDGTGVTNEYDDWELWIRASLAGGQIVRVPAAVYIAHVTGASMHRRSNARQRRAWHKEIGLIHFPDLYANFQ